MTEHDDTQTAQPPSSGGDVTRRVMLRGATVSGVALPFLAACGDGGDGASSGADGADEPSGTAASEEPDDSAGGTTVPAADVPVGGGTVLKNDKIVVTQPTEGDFKAFTAVCTHQGCTVTKVEADEIVCACHGSRFSIEDGSPVAGPAQSALAGKNVSVEGAQVSVS
jgi:Rieske Fe-S protein